MANKVPMSIWVSPKTKAAYTKRAKKAKQSASEVAREVLEAFLKVK